MKSAIVAFDRLQLANAVLRKVLSGEDAAAFPGCLDNRGPDGSRVKRVRTLCRDHRQGPREVPLDEAVAFGEHAPLRLENAGRVGIASQLIGLGRHYSGIPLAQDKALFGKPDRRSQKGRALHSAIPSPRRLETEHRPRHTDSQPAVGRPAGHRVASRILKHPRGRRERCLFAKIEEGRASVGQVNSHKPAAADVASLRIDDCERIADGHSGIDGIAAPSQHFDAHRGREMLGADHHAARSGNGLGIGGGNGYSDEGEAQSRETYQHFRMVAENDPVGNPGRDAVDRQRRRHVAGL